MLSFGTPLGLLALLAIPPVIAAYFLRRKQPVRVISALFLWRTPDQRADAGPKLERWSNERSLLLELLALCAATAFLSDVRCGSTQRQRHLVVVVDGSLSMQARVDGQTSSERAKALIASLATKASAASVTIIESGPRPTILAGPRLELGRALSQLEAWSPSQPAHDFAATMQLAEGLTEPGGRLELITDGPVTGPLPGVTHVTSVGRSAPNVALVSAQRTDQRGSASVTVRVINFSADSKRVPVVFEAERAPTQTQEVELGPGESAALRAGITTPGAVTVRLPSDALEADGVISLLAAPGREVTLELLEGLDLTAKTTLTRYLDAMEPPASPSETATALTIGAPGSTANVTLGVPTGSKLVSFIGPFFAQRNHPVLDDVHLAGVIWTAGPNPPGHVLISAGETVLMSEGDDDTLHLNLELTRSNIQKTEAWPILINNLIRAARNRAPGLPRKQFMVGEDVTVVTAAGSRWVLKHDSGAAQTILGVGAVTLGPLPLIGHWSLLKDGEPIDALEVLALDPLESDLTTRGPFVRDPEPGGAAALATLTASDTRSWWPLVLLMGLLVVDFVLTSTRRARR